MTPVSWVGRLARLPSRVVPAAWRVLRGPLPVRGSRRTAQSRVGCAVQGRRRGSLRRRQRGAAGRPLGRR